MTILKDLIASLPDDVAVRSVQAGAHWTAVCSRYCGLASTVTGDRPHDQNRVRDVGRLHLKSARELAEYALSDNPLESSLGVAAINSLLDVDESHAAFVVPPAMLGDAKLEAGWLAQITAAQDAYVRAVEDLMRRYEWVADKVHRRKMAREAARSLLPNATETKIVVSATVRAWRTMLELRCGEGAEQEIRRMAVAVLRALSTEAPRLFADFEIYKADDGAEAARVGYHKV
jgi:uncharacterized protein (DUF4213/DUF364 family)